MLSRPIFDFLLFIVLFFIFSTGNNSVFSLLFCFCFCLFVCLCVCFFQCIHRLEVKYHNLYKTSNNECCQKIQST